MIIYTVIVLNGVYYNRFMGNYTSLTKAQDSLKQAFDGTACTWQEVNAKYWQLKLDKCNGFFSIEAEIHLTEIDHVESKAPQVLQVNQEEGFQTSEVSNES